MGFIFLPLRNYDYISIPLASYGIKLGATGS